jgi:hypothetical protein
MKKEIERQFNITNPQNVFVMTPAADFKNREGWLFILISDFIQSGITKSHWLNNFMLYQGIATKSERWHKGMSRKIAGAGLGC